ncbi:MAG: patatin-like phospholipase family protein [Clostridia bacterium]|nr:patatin-like phospholipase family protein [Clostridia bacterium]
MILNSKKPKIGLVLSGGGARGFAHLGAIKAFEEYGLKFDFVSGTSAGSLVGAFYASGMKFEDMLNIARKIDEKDIRTSKLVFVPSKTDGIEKVITDNLGDINIEDLKIPFTATAVDLKSTDEICLTKGNLAKAVAASCCVPAIFQPVEHNNRLLCDGGLRNTMPADIPKIFGCDYVVAIDVNKSRLYGTDSTKLVDVVMCSVRILMESNVFKGYEYSDIVLRPETKRFKSTKTEGWLDMIEEGYREAINNMPAILRLFQRSALNVFKKKKLQLKFEKPVIE